jgi:DNA helicase IV
VSTCQVLWVVKMNEDFRERCARQYKERKAKAEERRIAKWNNRKALTFKQAIDKDLFTVECCNGCGKEGSRLYIQLRGMYGGNRYCRACAINALKKEYF